MRNDYLWDGSGEPDPEIQQMETALARFRHNRPAPAFPEITTQAAARPQSLQMRWVPVLAAVAAGILVIVSVEFLLPRPKSAPASLPGWDVTGLAGTPRVGTKAIELSQGMGKLGLGQVLETDSRSRASIRSEEIGQIEIEPDTRLRLLPNSSGLNRLALDRGTIHAAIWAPPGEFVVDTPSAVAVDLGCKYTLTVEDSGNGLLRTTLGWVGFKLAGHESFIPAGAACATRPSTGPGTPYFEDASEPFRSALSKLDLSDSTSEERAAALRVVLAQSRTRDALTLWHLLSRVGDSERSRVYDRLAELVPAPSGVTREGILRLDREMLDLWWDELDLGDISLWRHWERSWSGDGKAKN